MEVEGEQIQVRFTSSHRSRHVVGLVATEDEPLILTDPAALDRGIDRTVESWQRWSQELSCEGRWSEAVAAVRSAVGRTTTGTRCASSASTGVVNRARTSVCSPARRIRPISLIASSECPPSSKKWSHRPTRSTPSSSDQVSASVCSTSPSGAS